jgi:uncharacterized membrane protein (UPF0182 family)
LLKKILVAFGDQIAFEDTLDAALDSLFGGNSGATAGDGVDVVTPPTTDSGTDTGSSTDKPTSVSTNAALKAALNRASQAIQDKKDAMAASDWTAYGKADKALQSAIEAAVAALK